MAALNKLFLQHWTVSLSAVRIQIKHSYFFTSLNHICTTVFIYCVILLFYGGRRRHTIDHFHVFLSNYKLTQPAYNRAGWAHLSHVLDPPPPFNLAPLRTDGKPQRGRWRGLCTPNVTFVHHLFSIWLGEQTKHNSHQTHCWPIRGRMWINEQVRAG